MTMAALLIALEVARQKCDDLQGYKLKSAIYRRRKNQKKKKLTGQL